MMNAKVSGVRSIELGVRDLQQSADFYTKVWALEEVGSEGDAIHLRGTGSEHHLLTIRQRPKPDFAWRQFRRAGSRRGRSALRQGEIVWCESVGRAGPDAGIVRRRLRVPFRDAPRVCR